ncbi:MAG: Nif3-like dinuclear metal center hexameric protein [Deltaproteobacteria bacterium]|nr:Nif3-like dinuclear metal center hexameric protein [Deltaproteobacteria bacterium]MBN2670984.1 Nif3-like dinuclear metal center hexameric protein [Deltaproteobacteria bacterium]
MTNRNDIVSFLDDYLAINQISDKSMNGLQVEGATEITKVALATDAALATYEKASAQHAEMLIVHHGFIWGGIRYITGRNFEHIKYLINNDLNLYAAHLPLDMHPEVGNNALLANMVGLKRIKPFGEYMGTSVGFAGLLPEPMSLAQLETLYSTKLNTTAQTIAFGPDQISSVAIVSGGGASTLGEAIAKGFDCLITGEGSHDKYHEAREGNIHLMYLGHYKTETCGVIALGDKLKEEFPKLETVFIDEPTGY